MSGKKPDCISGKMLDRMSDKMSLWMPDHIMSGRVSVGRAHLKKVVDN